MTQILSYLRKYLKEHFHLKFYLAVALFLATCIALNYHFDFEDSVLDSYTGKPIKWLYMALSMAFPFLAICIFLYLFNIQRDWVASKEFWIKFILGFAIIGLERSFYYYYDYLKLLPQADYLFTFKLAGWGRTWITTIIPLLIFYYFYERKNDLQKHWYGLTLRDFDFKPYAILILIVFIGIGGASFISELNTYYPRYKFSGGTAFAEYHQIKEWVSVFIYEAVYGSYYVGVEFFFRGFLVIAFARVLGGHAVIAMVGSYVFLHFGKPAAETISSAFGGYLIGILAYYSNRIWGGVVLHVALAWFMELFAGLQNFYQEN
jgi:hypothetical protein